MTAKGFYIIVLLAALAIFWILPRTRLGTGLRKSLPLFFTMHVMGTVCGVLAVIAALGWPDLTTKGFLIIVLLAALAIFSVLPRTRLGTSLRMSLPLFYTTHVIGTVCGALAIIAALAWPERILAAHHFELILLPVLLVYLYAGAILSARGEERTYDEKQIRDMTRGAATAFSASVFAMLLVFALIREGALQGLVWFPICISFAIAAYSAATLYYFVRD